MIRLLPLCFFLSTTFVVHALPPIEARAVPALDEKCTYNDYKEDGTPFTTFTGTVTETNGCPEGISFWNYGDDASVQCCVRSVCNAGQGKELNKYAKHWCMNTYKEDECTERQGTFVKDQCPGAGDVQCCVIASLKHDSGDSTNPTNPGDSASPTNSGDSASPTNSGESASPTDSRELTSPSSQDSRHNPQLKPNQRVEPKTPPTDPNHLKAKDATWKSQAEDGNGGIQEASLSGTGQQDESAGVPYREEALGGNEASAWDVPAVQDNGSTDSTSTYAVDTIET